MKGEYFWKFINESCVVWKTQEQLKSIENPCEYISMMIDRKDQELRPGQRPGHEELYDEFIWEINRVLLNLETRLTSKEAKLGKIKNNEQ